MVIKRAYNFPLLAMLVFLPVCPSPVCLYPYLDAAKYRLDVLNLSEIIYYL